MFAIIEVKGKQYKIKKGDEIKIGKIKGEKGDKIEFDKVLLLTKERVKEVKIGQPYLEGVKVETEILEQGRDKKIIVIKYKPKTRYRRKRGHRQFYTKIRIIDLRC